MHGKQAIRPNTFRGVAIEDNDSSKETLTHSLVHNYPCSPSPNFKTEKEFSQDQSPQSDVTSPHVQNGCGIFVPNPSIKLRCTSNGVLFHRPFRYDDDDEMEVVNILKTKPRVLPYASDQVIWCYSVQFPYVSFQELSDLPTIILHFYPNNSLDRGGRGADPENS